MKEIKKEICKKDKIKRVIWILAFCFAITGWAFSGKSTLAAERTELLLTAPAGADAAAIQNLLTMNKNGQYNLTVVLPAGEYHLTKGLTVYSNTTIRAEEGSYFIKEFDYTPFIANDTTNDPGGYDASENITVIGGVWNANQEAYHIQGIECFRFIHAKNITVQDAEIMNVPEGSHLITLAGVDTALVENNVLHGYTGEMGKEAIHLDIVHDETMVPGTDNYDDTACRNITIQNNEVYDFPRGIGSHSAVDGVFHDTILIAGNNIHDVSDTAIRIFCYKNTTISQNVIKNAGIGVRVYTDLDGANYKESLQENSGTGALEDYNILIDDNTITDLTDIELGGYGISVTGSSNRSLQGITITNNLVKRVNNANAFGIRVTFCTGAVVTGNTIAGSDYGGMILLDSSTCTVKSNLISYTESYGIYMERTVNSIFAKNKIWSVRNSAIYLNFASNGCTLSYNTISKAGYNGSGDGIGMNRTGSVTLYKNTIKYPVKNGIALYNECTANKIVANYILSSGQNSIVLYNSSDKNKIKSNVITAPGKNGIAIYNSSLSNTIAYNKISKPAENGIAVYLGSNNAYILENTVTASSMRGIFIYKADKAKIVNNTISESTNNAIHVGTSADTYVDGNIFVNNLSYRIMITSDCTGCNVKTLK